MNPEGYACREAYREISSVQPKTPKPRYNCGDMVGIHVQMTVGNATRTVHTVGKVIGVFYDANDMNAFAYDIKHNELVFRCVSEKSL